MFLHARTYAHAHARARARTHTHTQHTPSHAHTHSFASVSLQDLLLSCRLSTQIASEMGAFGIAPAELMDMMAGTRITLNTDIGSYTRAFAGECSRSDIESLMGGRV